MAELLNSEIKEQVRQVFADLEEPVEVLFFGRAEDCLYCEDVQQLVREVVELSDLLSLRSYDLDDDAEIAAEYHVDKAPTLVLAAKNGAEIRDYGIRYAGIPSGHEFSSFIHDLLRVSSRDSGLNQATRDFLSKLSEPVHLQVFVTPT